MKKILALIITAVLISLLVIPVGTALADKDFHTVRLPLTLTSEGEGAGHTLRNGMVMKTHAEGPVNYYIMSVILNGAKPDTTYYIFWGEDFNPLYQFIDWIAGWIIIGNGESYAIGQGIHTSIF